MDVRPALRAGVRNRKEWVMPSREHDEDGMSCPGHLLDLRPEMAAAVIERLKGLIMEWQEARRKGWSQCMQ